MEENDRNFGMNKRQIPFAKYVGKWVTVYPQQANNFSGVLERIEDGYLILNPHQSVEFTSNGIKRTIVNEHSDVRASDVVGIEPTSEASVSNFCKQRNDFDAREECKKDLELQQLVMNLERQRYEHCRFKEHIRKIQEGVYEQGAGI
jgi:hypothetical protein